MIIAIRAKKKSIIRLKMYWYMGFVLWVKRFAIAYYTGMDIKNFRTLHF